MSRSTENPSSSDTSGKPSAERDARPPSDRSAADTAELQRKIQREQAARDEARQSHESRQDKQKTALQAGPHDEPENPLPGQRLDKPGLEADMQLRPRFSAPGYVGSGKLAGMAAVITGGDSGIGRAVAVLFAREGADVAIVYLDEHADAHETKRCVEAEGRRCILLPGDVRGAAFCKQAVQQAVDAFGRLDILVNNAAFQSHASDIADITEEQLDMTLRTNVHGYFHMVQAALPHLRKGGSILNTGSTVGLGGSAELLDYSATKGAIHAFTKSLAANLVKRGIRVNAVAPGPVWTPLNPADKKPEDLEKFGSATDIGRVAQPEELAPAYVFLAAPSCASYITGIVLPVTGSVESI